MCGLCVTVITVTSTPPPRNAPPGAVPLAPMPRRRVDTLLAERGLADSRTSAAASVRAGLVRVGAGGERAQKPSQLVAEDADLVLEERPRFVSRGGIKLENAIEALRIPIESRACLDVGASTGGFTDCLLQHGAARVVALDVAYGQLDWRLRGDPRVEVIERVNARHLNLGDLPYAPELVTVDVSFISLAKVLPALSGLLAPHGEVLALVKPQFELGRGRVGRGGVVPEAADRREALVSVARAAGENGLHVRGFASSGLPGPKGNMETFIHCTRDGPGLGDVEAAALEVEP
jgi:23S rRNA (cytidine1920-2'-O)/16S rRNA (cytidine1409-2'-O)-methyltransferase